LSEERAPRLALALIILREKDMKRFLITFALLSILTLMVAACSRDTPAPPSNSGGGGGGGGGATVHMGDTNFIQTSITLNKGDSLTLVDDSAIVHIIGNGSWDGSNAKPAKEDGAPTVSQMFNGNDTKTVGPFTTAGTFHLYCSVHPGMNLTVTVQ
jgi:plastocyanin